MSDGNVNSDNDMDTAIQALVNLGLSASEAKTYVALLKHGPIAASPLARKAGIAQPKIYSYLDALQQKGFVIKQAVTGKPNTYKAISYQTVLETLRQRLEANLDSLSTILDSLARSGGPTQVEDYFTLVQGRRNVKLAIQDMLHESAEPWLVVPYAPVIVNLLRDMTHDNQIVALHFPPELLKSPPFSTMVQSFGSASNGGASLPAIFLTAVDFKERTARSSNILLPATEDAPMGLVQIKHPAAVDIHTKLIIAIRDGFKPLGVDFIDID